MTFYGLISFSYVSITSLIRNIRNTKQRETSIESQPKHHISHELVALDRWCPAHQDQWDLDELHQEQVHAASATPADQYHNNNEKEHLTESSSSQSPSPAHAPWRSKRM
jgi:hypothetical protein